HGSKLWITFMRDRLYWGFLEGRPRAEPKLEGVSRRVRGGWRSTDINGEELRKDRLSGGLTQLASYRGTSCSVRMSDYVIRRINGQKTPEVESALAATAS